MSSKFRTPGAEFSAAEQSGNSVRRVAPSDGRSALIVRPEFW